MDSQSASVYQRGARDGLLAGALMLAMFVCQALGLTQGLAWLTWVSDALMLAVPVAAYVMMRRGFRLYPAQRQFATLWMHGIIIFICGSLIMAAGIYAYCRLIDPGFIPRMFDLTGQLLAQMPDASMAQMGEQFGQLAEQGLTPTPIQMAFSYLWLGSFSGSMLSMLLAAILRLSNNNAKQ